MIFGSSLSEEERRLYIDFGIVCVILCIVTLAYLLFEIAKLIFGESGLYLGATGTAVSILVFIIGAVF